MYIYREKKEYIYIYIYSYVIMYILCVCVWRGTLFGPFFEDGGPDVKLRPSISKALAAL